MEPSCFKIELTTKDWELVVKNSKCPDKFKPELRRILVGNLAIFQFMASSEIGVNHMINTLCKIEEHLLYIAVVFKKLRRERLTVHISKIKICVQEIKYLGYRITPVHARINPDKIATIKDFLKPKKVKNLKQFLKLVGYYRRFIPHYSEMSNPLTTLLGNDIPWVWDSEQREAFEKIKEALINPVGSDLPDFEKPFTIQTDASGIGLGAILLQEHVIKIDENETSSKESSEVKEKEKTVLKPIYFASRGLTKAEANYSATELECLAVIWAIKKFKKLLNIPTLRLRQTAKPP